MKTTFFSVAILGALLLTGCGPKESGQPAHPGAITAGPHTRVDTKYGTVEGYLDDDVYTFKGIRYAKAGRFMPPQDPDKFEGVRMCKLFGPRAPQGTDLVWRDNTQTDYYFGNKFNLEPMSEEECFVLNVWTKGLDKTRKRPVFVWLHGGGFSGGSAHDLDCYEGRNLADKGDIVTVSVNHRLNVLGYMDLTAVGGKYEHSVNLGHQDIVKALEWIRDNIEKFGGDPNQVTIAGQSGGGGKVTALMVMPSAKGLFHRGIVQSGSYLRVASAEYGRMLGLAFLEELGVKPSQAEAKLGTFTYEQLAEAGNRATRKVTAATGERGGFGPVLDGTIITEQTFDPVAASQMKDITMIIGSNFNEFNFDTSVADKTPEEIKASLAERMGAEKAAQVFETFQKTYPEKKPGAILFMENRFRSGSLQQATLKSRQGGAPVYLYQFNWMPENNVLGAAHGMELPFMSNNVAIQREMTGSSESAYKLEEIMSNYWLSFIKTGDPNCAGQPAWEPFTEEKGACMIFDTTCGVRYNHDKALLELLK